MISKATSHNYFQYKKMRNTAIIGLSLFLLMGCTASDTVKNDLLEAQTKITENVEVLGGKLDETKKNIDAKVEEVKSAVNSGKEAVDSIQKASEDVGKAIDQIGAL